MHRLSPCFGLLTALVLLNSVARWCNRIQFFQKWCNFTRLCAWASEGIFPGRATSGFFLKFFYGRPKVVKLVFYHSKLRKQHFLLKFQFPVPLLTPIRLCVGKVRATPLKNVGNFKRFNTIPNSEILLKFKQNIWRTNFNCVFVSALAALNSYIIFLHWQHNWHL